MSHLLWRIDGAGDAPPGPGWQPGLRLHLRFQPLTTIIARRDGRTRHYLALEGCPSCRPDGCDQLCHRMLFEQLVRTTLPGITLIATPRLVPRATETRRIAAIPRRPDARPLDAAFLAQWAEGRLLLTWAQPQAKTRPIRVGALLAVGKDGPDPGQALRAYGWTDNLLATMRNRAAFTAHIPGPISLGGRAGDAVLHALGDWHDQAGDPSETSCENEHDTTTLSAHRA